MYTKKLNRVGDVQDPYPIGTGGGENDLVSTVGCPMSVHLFKQAVSQRSILYFRGESMSPERSLV